MCKKGVTVKNEIIRILKDYQLEVKRERFFKDLNTQKIQLKEKIVMKLKK